MDKYPQTVTHIGTWPLHQKHVPTHHPMLMYAWVRPRFLIYDVISMATVRRIFHLGTHPWYYYFWIIFEKLLRGNWTLWWVYKLVVFVFYSVKIRYGQTGILLRFTRVFVFFILWRYGSEKLICLLRLTNTKYAKLQESLTLLNRQINIHPQFPLLEHRPPLCERRWTLWELISIWILWIVLRLFCMKTNLRVDAWNLQLPKMYKRHVWLMFFSTQGRSTIY